MSGLRLSCSVKSILFLSEFSLVVATPKFDIISFPPHERGSRCSIEAKDGQIRRKPILSGCSVAIFKMYADKAKENLVYIYADVNSGDIEDERIYEGKYREEIPEFVPLGRDGSGYAARNRICDRRS